jgi:hypothetical protein
LIFVAAKARAGVLYSGALHLAAGIFIGERQVLAAEVSGRLVILKGAKKNQPARFAKAGPAGLQQFI